MVQYSIDDSLSKLFYQRYMICFMMVLKWLVCQCDSVVIDLRPDVKLYTSPLIGYTNGSIEIDCDVNTSNWFNWTKEGKPLKLGNRVIISSDGRLIFRTLYKNDSGDYTCVDGLSETRNDLTLLVVDNQTKTVINTISPSPPHFPSGTYTLPEWMISVACVLLIATITIVIIVSYVKISKPKKGDISTHSSELPETTDTIEVFVANQSTKKSYDEECKLPKKGMVRQRKSSSTPKHDSYSIQNECPQEKSTSKNKKRGKYKVDGRNERLCSVEYIQEIPDKLGLVEGNKTIEDQSVKCESPRSFPAPDIHDSVEQAKHLNSEHLEMKYLPGKATPDLERLKKTNTKSGQALRKIISDPCLMNRPPFPANESRNNDFKGTDGQDMKRGSSEILNRTDPIHLEPIIKGSLKLDKKALRELKSKIQKCKSPAEILASKSKRKDYRSKTLNYEPVSFTNQIYETIEELKGFKDEPKTIVYVESEMEPIYEIIQIPTSKQNKGDIDEQCDSGQKERKKSNSGLQNMTEEIINEINDHSKSYRKRKQSYEPKKLDFDDPPNDSVLFEETRFSTPAEANEKEHEKCFENLSFSILEDLDEFEGDFDEVPNKVVDGIYRDLEKQEEYHANPSILQQLPEDTQNLNASREENLYDEIYHNDY